MNEHTKQIISAKKPNLVNKADIRKILEKQDQATGFILDSSATPQMARALTLAQGVRPEDNSFSCEISRMREGDTL